MADVVDFFPRPKKSAPTAPPPSAGAGAAGPRRNTYRRASTVPQELKQWLVRRAVCIRGELTLGTLVPSLLVGPGGYLKPPYLPR